MVQTYNWCDLIHVQFRTATCTHTNIGIMCKQYERQVTVTASEVEYCQRLYIVCCCCCSCYKKNNENLYFFTVPCRKYIIITKSQNGRVMCGAMPSSSLSYSVTMNDYIHTIVFIRIHSTVNVQLKLNSIKLLRIRRIYVCAQHYRVYNHFNIYRYNIRIAPSERNGSIFIYFIGKWNNCHCIHKLKNIPINTTFAMVCTSWFSGMRHTRFGGCIVLLVLKGDT